MKFNREIDIDADHDPVVFYDEFGDCVYRLSDCVCKRCGQVALPGEGCTCDKQVATSSASTWDGYEDVPF